MSSVVALAAELGFSRLLEPIDERYQRLDR